MITSAPTRALRDPVCQMPLTPSNLTNVRSFNGELLYFCSEMCAEKFDRDPAHYVGDVIQHVELPIYGFLRGYEAFGLEFQLGRLPGVKDVTVDPLTEVASITYDGRQADVTSLTAAIQRAGYRTR